MSAKSKKYLVFAELISKLPCEEEIIHEKIFPDEHLFLFSSQDPWYGDIILYLQTLKFPPTFSKDKRRKLRHLTKKYGIIGDTLYCHGIYSILMSCLTLEEVESILNDCHSGSCGNHLSRLTTTQNVLRVGYFQPSIFKDCIEVVKYSILVKYILEKCMHIQLRFSLLSPSVLSRSGALILLLVIHL